MESKNEQMVQTLVTAVLATVDDAAILAEADKRGVFAVSALSNDALLLEVRKREDILLLDEMAKELPIGSLTAEVKRRFQSPEFLTETLMDVPDEALWAAIRCKEDLDPQITRDAVMRWIENDASGNDKREVADLLPPRTLVDSLADEGHLDLVLEAADDDSLWENIDDKDWIVQRNVDDLDQEALLEEIDGSTKDEWCEQWWEDSKKQLLSECDDAELWEAINAKDQFLKPEANIEEVERILTDCDTDGLIAALGVIARRLRGW